MSGQAHGPGRRQPGEVRRREPVVSLNKGVTGQVPHSGQQWALCWLGQEQMPFIVF